MSDEIPPATASDKSAPEIGPVRPKERIEVIDILRGWAIFGMVVANVWGFQSFFFTFPFQLTQVWTGTADQIVLSKFAEAKQQFDEGPGRQKVLPAALVPVNGKPKNSIDIRNDSGQPLEEYFKCQFI